MRKTPISPPYPFPYCYSFTILFNTLFLFKKKQCIMYLSTDMWYKKVQVILGLVKRENLNLIVVTFAKRE